jgi:diacylglycerol O-acyltransferase / trehalose O-mycolyltransferase
MTPTHTRPPRMRCLVAGLTVLALSAGCSGNASPTLAPAATREPTTTAPATPGPTSIPTPSQAATIGLPADDGARIIAVDTNPPLIHCTNAGCSTPTVVPGRRARDLTIESPAVGTVKVRLLVPANFDAQPSTHWPVLYLLDGGAGSHTTWTEVFDIEALSASTNLLVVMPDAGTDGGYYSNWWNGGKGGPPEWETFHLVELRQLLERNWQAGDKRAIAGFSMGGYGAMEYAERQPGMFRIAASYSGVLDPLGGPDFSGVAGVSPWLWGDRVAQADVWKAHDPTTNAAALKGTGLYVAYGNGEIGPLDSGSYDPLGVTEREIAAESAAFVKRLAGLKIPVTVYAYTGTHFDPYWERDLHLSFPLILKALGS